MFKPNEYDDSKANRADEVPHLKKLQSDRAGKSRIKIILGVDVLSKFKEKSERAGGCYQTLFNQTLRVAMGSRSVDEVTLKRVLREEPRSD